MLVVGQARRCAELPGARLVLVLEYLLESTDHAGARRGKVLFNLGELTPRMRQTMTADQRLFVREFGVRKAEET